MKQLDMFFLKPIFLHNYDNKGQKRIR